MKNYLKLPLSEYERIQEALDLAEAARDPVTKMTKILYAKNLLFENTHNFDTGKPYLHNDKDIKTK